MTAVDPDRRVVVTWLDGVAPERGTTDRPPHFAPPPAVPAQRSPGQPESVVPCLLALAASVVSALAGVAAFVWWLVV